MVEFPCLFGFYKLFGNFLVRVLTYVRETLRSVCSVDFVEKMWETMRKSVWGNGGKIYTWSWFDEFYTKICENLHICSGCGGKISRRFTHDNNRDRSMVLHNFHIAYYYNY